MPERDCPTSIQADDVKSVLADIDTDRGDHTLQDLGHDLLLSFGASCQPTGRQGQEHGRTIPLADFGAHRLSIPSVYNLLQRSTGTARYVRTGAATPSRRHSGG